MNRNDRAPSVFMTEKMVTTLGTNDVKASTTESSQEIFCGNARKFCHLLHRDALNTNKFTAVINPLLDFQTQINRLADAHHQPIQ